MAKSATTSSSQLPEAPKTPKAPAILKGAPVLRVLGTSVTLLDCIRDQARKDLGIDIRFEVLDGVAAQTRGVLSPESFDIYDQWFHNVDFIWPASAVQPIDIKRITHWDEINSLPKTGRITLHAPLGDGSKPVDRLYVQPDGNFGPRPTGKITMLPVSHNADSFGYRRDLLPADLISEEESWGWLVDERCCGLVGLQSDCAIGALDAALAVEAKGLAKFNDIGNLSIEEIDRLIECLIKLKRNNHFRTFWSDHSAAVEQMKQGAVGIESLWSPALIELKAQQLDLCMAAPREGYRAWYGGMSISRCATGRVLDAAYDYMNWWLSGWPGALIARQGYYISNPQRSRPLMSKAEWDYWYDGKPASEDLLGVSGDKPVIRKGEVREGGSYIQRMSQIAVWNSVMDEHNYLVRRWHDFMSA